MANLPDDLQAALDVAARLHAQAMSILSIQRNVGHFATLVFGVTSLNDGEPVRNSWRDAVGELLSIHATESPKIRAIVSQLQPQPTLFTFGGTRAPTASELLLEVCDEIARDYDFVFHERTSEPIDSNKFEAMLASAGPDYVPPVDQMSFLAGLIADRVSLHGPLLQQLTSLRKSIDAELGLVDWQRRNRNAREDRENASTEREVVALNPLVWMNRKLTLDGKVIALYKRKAFRQFVVLDAFQLANWKSGIPSPARQDIEAEHAVRELNRRTRLAVGDTVQFSFDRTTGQITWRRESPEAIAPPTLKRNGRKKPGDRARR